MKVKLFDEMDAYYGEDRDFEIFVDDEPFDYLADVFKKLGIECEIIDFGTAFDLRADWIKKRRHTNDNL